MLRILLPAVSFALIAGCGGDQDTSPAGETPLGSPDAAAGSDARSGDGGENPDRIGRIYHYVRSNIDGSEREDVYVFRKAADMIEVYKARGKCENAALVSAELDLDGGYATEIIGGRLQPGARKEESAVLTYDPAEKIASARIEPPGRSAMGDTAEIGMEPWHLYDFDLASLTVTAQDLEPGADFSFGLALTIPEPGREDILLYLGQAQATYRDEETRGDFQTRRYALGGPAFGTYGGNIWLDAEEGHIVDVETGIPNHLDYRDFKLALEDIDDGGEQAWRKLLSAHFEDCE